MKTETLQVPMKFKSLDNILKAIFQEIGKSRRNEQIPKYM